jgi:hypothetical protein
MTKIIVTCHNFVTVPIMPDMFDKSLYQNLNTGSHMHEIAHLKYNYMTP